AIFRAARFFPEWICVSLSAWGIKAFDAQKRTFLFERMEDAHTHAKSRAPAVRILIGACRRSRAEIRFVCRIFVRPLRANGRRRKYQRVGSVACLQVYSLHGGGWRNYR